MQWKNLVNGQIFNKTRYDHFVEIKGCNLHYRELPAKKGARHVVLLHGFASSTYTWEKIDYLLNAEGYHVWSLDMKGFGWSEKPRNVEYDALTLMEEVNEWMEYCDIKDAIFVGNSFGGGIALLLANTYPKRLGKIVLIDAGAYRMKFPFIMKLLRFPLTTLFAKFVFGRWMVKWIIGQVMYSKKRVTAEQIDAYYDRMLTPNAIYAQIALSRAIDFDVLDIYVEKLPDINKETLILWGEKDAWIPLRFGYKFRGVMNNSHLTVIKDCGHIPQEEKPEAVFSLINKFIKGEELPDEVMGGKT